jgi:tRNA dimethylallyltransferase
MASNDNIKSPIVVIVGQTSTGKSALAMEIARCFNGAIIAADSRTVYKEMNIGTAKPSHADRSEIVHYGLDVVAPNEHFTAFDFKLLAEAAITRIVSDNRLPIIVGGSGLYIDALLYDFTFRKTPEAGRRKALERSLRPNTLLLGLCAPREALRRRITLRVNQMVEDGLVEEVSGVQEKYGLVEPMRAPGYRAFIGYLHGDYSLQQAKDIFIRSDLQLAKRQMTWFKRNKSIRWLSLNSSASETIGLVATFLDTTKSKLLLQ